MKFQNRQPRILSAESNCLRLPGDRISRKRFRNTHFWLQVILYYNFYFKSIKKNQQLPRNTKNIIQIGENHLIYLTSAVKETVTVLFKIKNI